MKPIMLVLAIMMAFSVSLPSEVLAQMDVLVRDTIRGIERRQEREHMIIMGALIVGGLGFLLAIVANISRAARKEKKRNRKKAKKKNRAKHRAAFAAEESAPEAKAAFATEEGAPKAKAMIKNIGIALAVVIHVPNIVFLDRSIPYPLLLVLDAITWFFVMFFVARAVHRPWREGRIATATFFVIGCVVFAFSEPWIGSGKAPGVLIIMWIVGTYFTARDVNRRVKKAEEEKRQAVEQPAQESVEERAQEEQ